MNDPDFVVIPTKEYEALKRDSMILAALEAGGVDNWEWYSESLKDAGVFEDDEANEDDD